MKQNHLKLIRVSVSLLFLFCTSAVFMDYLGQIATPIIDYILYLQFIPSLIDSIHSAAWVSSGFILILICTLLFGRLFCSFICPLGGLQDIFIRIFQRIKGKKHCNLFSYQKPLNLLRNGVLILTTINYFMGTLLLLSLLDPFSQFGRIMTNLVRPVLILIYNTFVTGLQWTGIYALYPLGYKAPASLSLLLPLFILILLLCFTAEKGRLFCNTFCPVGTLLGLVTHHALFKISINNSRCTHCGKCAMQCKACCINLKESTVDFSRCVSCFNCIRTCPEEAIRYHSHFNAQDEKKHVNKQERRIILTSLMCFFLIRPRSGNSQQPTLKKIAVRNRIASTVVNEKNYPVAPPGSISIKHLLFRCTACHLCISACPTKVLQPALGEYGPSGLLKPRLDAQTGFCNFDCIRCGEVCPTGAIQLFPLKKKKQTQMGQAQFIKKNCVVETDKKDCGACAEHCPTKAVRMVPFEGKLKIPELKNKYCIGCGACEHICPVQPHKAIFVDGLATQRIAEPPESKPVTVVPMVDFPF